MLNGLKKLTVISNGFQEDYMVNYLNSLVGKIDQIDFLGSSLYPKEKIDQSINFYDIHGGGKEGLSTVQKIKRVVLYYSLLIYYFLRTSGRSIVHIHWLRFPVWDGILLPLYFMMLGKRLVYTVHDIVPHDNDTVLNRFTFRIIYNLNHKLVVHTEFLKKRLCEEFNIPPEKVAVIRHGVYEVSDENVMLNTYEAKKTLGINPDNTLILFFGYITHYKGLDILLQAVSQSELQEKLNIIVAGRVWESYKTAFNKLQERYKNNSTIRFMIRRIEDEELPLLFGAADITALPYREASQSGVLFMSYAYGVPVIAPDIGGFPYDVIHGKTGFIFKSEDTRSLTHVIENFVKGHYSSQLLARNEIRRFARENYSWEKSGQELIKFINN